jgi:hypothetical protein
MTRTEFWAQYGTLVSRRRMNDADVLLWYWNKYATLQRVNGALQWVTDLEDAEHRATLAAKLGLPEVTLFEMRRMFALLERY